MCMGLNMDCPQKSVEKSTWLLLLLLRRTPRALESGPRERQLLLGVGREDSEWGRRTTKGVLPEAIQVGASLQPDNHVCT